MHLFCPHLQPPHKYQVSTRNANCLTAFTCTLSCVLYQYSSRLWHSTLWVVLPTTKGDGQSLYFTIVCYYCMLTHKDEAFPAGHVRAQICGHVQALSFVYQQCASTECNWNSLAHIAAPPLHSLNHASRPRTVGAAVAAGCWQSGSFVSTSVSQSLSFWSPQAVSEPPSGLQTPI